MASLPTEPGRDWLDILTRPTLAAFSAAFSIDPELSASVLYASIHGVARIRAFFAATRAMYDPFAFTRESRAGDRSFLEWEGSYRGKAVEGVTILERDSGGGAISRIRLFHLPYHQVVAFADDLSVNLGDHSTAATPRA